LLKPVAMTTHWRLVAMVCLAACGGGPAGPGGATPGGVKDLRAARELIEDGFVPPPEALVVEGMFAEHDLPLEGAPCSDPLCPRLALGIAPDHAGEPQAWLQVGLASGIDIDAWQRPTTTFVMTVDCSGSMSGVPIHVARDVLRRIGDQLGPEDRVAIVTYGDEAHVMLEPTRGDDPRYRHLVGQLSTGGSTAMEAGLDRAYALARGALDAPGLPRNARVVLFTDVQPNVGATEPSEFEAMAAVAGEDGIGLTVLALGTGLDPAGMKAMAAVRGANAFSLFDDGDAARFMDEEWPYFTAPVATDLRLEVRLPDTAELAGAYGFPQGTGARPGLTAASVFLSQRAGALLL
jgi:Ca-activated chloride channel family protein